MNNKEERRIILVIVSVIVIFLIVVFFCIKKIDREIIERKQHTEEIYGNIQFKGRVLKVHKIDRWGRVYGMMCIKLDYINVNNFYKFDNISCLKIKNNIATLPTGFLGNDEGYDKLVNAILNAIYIEVNMDNSRQMCFIDSLGNKFIQYHLDYGSNNLIESDMRICDGCRD